MNYVINDVRAMQILDSRGNPTIKASVKVNEIWGDFLVPSGASTGIHEALELRDGGKEFAGFGVKKAIVNIEKVIKPAIVGKSALNQREIDSTMIALDGTKNKEKLGANAILAVSGALTRATAKALGLELFEYLQSIYENNGEYKTKYSKKYKTPDLYMNILNGGAHAANNVDIQETMIVPVAKSVEKRVQIGAEVYHSLKNVLKSRALNTALGDEGGFAPDLESNIKVFEVVMEAIEKAGYKPGKDVKIALDVAASEFYEKAKDEKYILASENIGLSSTQLVSWYKELLGQYPICSIEDGLDQDDWEGWKAMTERIGKEVQLVGDDLFVTNPQRVAAGIKDKIANAVLIKVNQIGSITETLDAIKMATENKYKCMISHRSGETEDSYIADLVIATGVGQIKSGAPARSERTVKYNRLLEIEKMLS